MKGKGVPHARVQERARYLLEGMRRDQLHSVVLELIKTRPEEACDALAAEHEREEASRG